MALVFGSQFDVFDTFPYYTRVLVSILNTTLSKVTIIYKVLSLSLQSSKNKI